MTYGAERWTMQNKDERMMNKNEMRMLRWIQLLQGVSLRDHITNEEIRIADNYTSDAQATSPVGSYM